MDRDPISKSIYGGIKRGIQVAIDNECLGSAVILIFSGIDTMAFLNMPGNQNDVTRIDFITWAEKYIKFPCTEQLTGFDLYGSRCALLHSFGVESQLSREGKCRIIGYMSESIPEIRYNPAVNKDLVMVSIPALAQAFFDAIDRFLVELFADSAKAKIAEKRLSSLIQCIQIREQNADKQG